MPATARPKVENAEYAAMVRRMVRAYGRRLSDSDPTDLPAALGIIAEMDAAIATAVQAMRESAGFSWAEIAAYTGTSRQAAQQRWGKPRA